MAVAAQPPAESFDEAATDIPIALKGALVDEKGVRYRDFRRTLTPHYGRVWRDIAAGYAFLFTVPVVIALWDPSAGLAIGAAVVGALLVGYTLAYLNNFFHEAAHHNLLVERRRNDLATNALFGWLYGSDIATYRKIHFQHHRALGTTEDSENSYFDVLGTRYLVEGLFGLKVLRTLRRYRVTERSRSNLSPSERSEGDATGRSRVAWMAGGGFLHLAMVVALWVLGSPAAALAWLAGVLLVFPFFVSLRQVLEHRAEDADPDIDYTGVDHGAVNRLFGDGPVANTLGSAGFNRHALHHWEPNVSYTRLGDIEQYLLRSDVAPLIRNRRTTYAQTFLRLFEL
jgi:fatty acid desaturase